MWPQKAQHFLSKSFIDPEIDLVPSKTYILIPYLQPKYGLKKVIRLGKNEGVASEGQKIFILDKNRLQELILPPQKPYFDTYIDYMD